jgi:hypothetical protein
MSLCAAASLAYVLWSNSLTAGNYQAAALHRTLTELTGENGQLLAHKSDMEDPAAALRYALSRNMVEAKDFSYIFENGNIAKR